MASVNNLNIFTFIKDIYQSLKHIDKTSTLSNDTLNKRITKLEENQQILIDKCNTIELLLNKLGENNTTQHNLDKTIEFELLEKMKKINQNEINNDKLNLKPEELTFANVIENNYNLLELELKMLLKLVIKENHYKKDPFMKYMVFHLMEFYFRKLNLTFSKNITDKYSYLVRRISDTKTFNLDEESLFMEFDEEVLDG